MLESAKSHWECLQAVGPQGVTSHGVRVNRFDSGRASYFLKAKETVEDVEREIMILTACRQSNFPAAEPIAANDGQYFVQHEGKCYVLTTALGGASLTDVGPREGKWLGQSIAQFQNAVLGLSWGTFPKYEGRVSNQLTRLKKLRQGRRDVDRLIKLFEPLRDGEQLSEGLIHRDPHPRNMLFSDGRLTGFVDFDLVKVGPRIFDPCYCATGLLVAGWEQKSHRERWPTILASIVDAYYQTARPPLDERRSTLVMLLEIQLIFVIWHIENSQNKLADLNEQV